VPERIVHQDRGRLGRRQPLPSPADQDDGAPAEDAREGIVGIQDRAERLSGKSQLHFCFFGILLINYFTDILHHQGNQEWKDAERLIINECEIVCCTLAMAGSAKLDSFVNSFEYLIVDEACQSTEMQTLIPMRLAPKRVILVGD